MSLLKKKELIILILVGILIRLLLAFLPGFKIDVDAFFAWAVRLYQLGLPSFYSKDVFTDYTPGYLYVLYLLGYIRNLFQLTSDQFYYLLKIPAIIAEVLLGVFCFKEVFSQKLTNKNLIIISSLIFFNLALIFNSSIWGQVDSVLTIFMLLSIYYLKKEQYLLTSLFLGIAFLVKPQTIAIMPIFLLFLIKKSYLFKKPNNLFLISIPALLAIFILSLPFFPTQPFTGLINRVLETAGQYDYTSLFAYNLWGIVGTWIKDSELGWFNLAYKNWGYILLSGYWILLAFLCLRKKIPLYTMAALATLGFYFLPTRVHERYLYPALIFLIFAAIELKSTFLLIAQIFLSLIYLLSLYRVFVYYNYFYNHLPVSFYNPNLYNFLDSNEKLLSVVSTTIFIIITVYIIKLSHGQKSSNST